MIYDTNDLLKIYKTKYMIKKKIGEGVIFKIGFNIFSDKRIISYESVISKKYPQAIFTLNSAFYLFDLTDVLPEKYHLATLQDSYNINDVKIVQSYQLDHIFYLGKTKIDLEDGPISIYDKERLLIELVRFKNQFPLDYYKEIIKAYRKITDELNGNKIKEYLSHFIYGDSYFKIIMEEVN